MDWGMIGLLALIVVGVGLCICLIAIGPMLLFVDPRDVLWPRRQQDGEDTDG